MLHRHSLHKVNPHTHTLVDKNTQGSNSTPFTARKKSTPALLLHLFLWTITSKSEAVAARVGYQRVKSKNTKINTPAKPPQPPSDHHTNHEDYESSTTLRVPNQIMTPPPGTAATRPTNKHVPTKRPSRLQTRLGAVDIGPSSRSPPNPQHHVNSPKPTV
jgi:hypothetical protein